MKLQITMLALTTLLGGGLIGYIIGSDHNPRTAFTPPKSGDAPGRREPAGTRATIPPDAGQCRP